MDAENLWFENMHKCRSLVGEFGWIENTLPGLSQNTAQAFVRGLKKKAHTFELGIPSGLFVKYYFLAFCVAPNAHQWRKARMLQKSVWEVFIHCERDDLLHMAAPQLFPYKFSYDGTRVYVRSPLPEHVWAKIRIFLRPIFRKFHLLRLSAKSQPQ